MMVTLLPTPVEACKRNFQANTANCSGFVYAVARELLVLLPAVNMFDANERGSADVITMWIQKWMPGAGSPFIAIPPGESAALQAMHYADRGDFVIAGATREMINRYRSPTQQTANGHVAVVTPGTGNNGFPRGYWGTLGGTGRANESLSLSFNARLKNELRYFTVTMPGNA